MRKAWGIKWLIVLVLASALYLYIRMEMTLTPVEFYTPRRSSATVEKNGIPFVLHEFWHSRRMPKHMSDVVKRHIEMNPEFEVYVYSEAEAVSFIKEHFGPEVLRAYYSFKPSAFRSDLFRYCVLYVKGGVYVDTKIDFSVPLKDLIYDSKPLMLGTVDKWCEGKGVQNCFIIAPPKSDLMARMIEEIVISSEARLYNVNELDITGPCMIGRIIDSMGQSNLRDKARCLCSEEGIDFVITCDGKKVARSYSQYRDEQKAMQKEPRYVDLYKKHDIYW
jgi:mannosyltransferase OCH1-like enzyme